jgi:hypothetical protein
MDEPFPGQRAAATQNPLSAMRHPRTHSLDRSLRLPDRFALLYLQS